MVSLPQIVMEEFNMVSSPPPACIGAVTWFPSEYRQDDVVVVRHVCPQHPNASILILFLPFTGCVILGKWLHCSGPQLACLWSACIYSIFLGVGGCL